MHRVIKKWHGRRHRGDEPPLEQFPVNLNEIYGKGSLAINALGDRLVAGSAESGDTADHVEAERCPFAANSKAIS